MISIPDFRPTISGARMLFLCSLCLGHDRKGIIGITQSRPFHCLVYEPALKTSLSALFSTSGLSCVASVSARLQEKSIIVLLMQDSGGRRQDTSYRTHYYSVRMGPSELRWRYIRF